MAYKVIILYQLYMPSYFLGTFTEYPYLIVRLFYAKYFYKGIIADYHLLWHFVFVL